MKPRIKFALLVSCLAFIPLLNSSAATIQVRVGAGGLKFTPQDVTIQVGDTVQWVWARNGHSTTSGTPGSPNGIWDSGVQNKNFVFNHVFSSAGTFPYYCSPHGACCGMIGSVTVSGTTTSAGKIFVNGNGTANQVWMYNRATDGQLSLVGAFSTQGAGARFKLSSQGSVALSDSKGFLYVTNSASNDVTAFSVQPTGLTFIGKVPSGGTFPNSIDVFGNFLYVLNSKGTTANITGFTIQSNGSLQAIPNSTRLLSSARPESAQVGFTPDGKYLLITEKTANNIDTFAIGTDGLATGPTAQPTAGGSPFGFAFDGLGHLVISEIANGSASSYTVTNGILNVVTAKLKDLNKAPCWTSATSGSSVPQFAYISNTNSDTISGFAVASNGALSLLKADGKSAVLPTGAFPLDMAISNDNKYFYVLEGNLPGVAGFQIQADGSLVQIQDQLGIPASSSGLTGY